MRLLGDRLARRVALVILLTALLWIGSDLVVAHAQDDSPAVSVTTDRPLVVGIYHEPPFAISVQEGTAWDGLSVQLWREIAESLELSYTFQEVDRESIIELVADGAIDVSLVTVATFAGEERIDFTQTYFTTYLGVAERREQAFADVVRAVISSQFLSTAFWVSVLVAVMGALLWLIEGRNYTDTYGNKPYQGIWTGFWWAAVTLSTTGYGDIVPKTHRGRILALIWILLSMVILASLTATITTVLTQTSGFQPVTFPEGLRDSAVGAVEESLGTQLLEAQEIDYRSFESTDLAIQALRDDEIDVVLDSLAALRYVRTQSINPLTDLSLQSTGRVPQHYAFGLKDGSPLIEPINQLILRRINGAQWHEVVNRYVPEE
jgi:polar amino acid transport system substrate-binding protein